MNSNHFFKKILAFLILIIHINDLYYDWNQLTKTTDRLVIVGSLSKVWLIL